MSAAAPHAEESAPHTPICGDFVRYAIEDVLALLEFISGRAKPPLKPISNDELGEFSRIAGQFESDKAIAPADFARLVSLRDALNVKAAPATGNSVIFTIMVMEEMRHRRRDNPGKDASRPFQLHAERLQQSARELAGWLKVYKWALVIALVLSVIGSAYVAGGKLLLDTRDAINRDTGANNSLIYGDIDSKAEHSVSYAFNASQQGQRPVPQSDLLPAGTAILSGPSVSTGTAAGKPDDLIETFCREPHPSALTFQHCKANYELLRRKDASINQLIRWVPPLIRVNTSATSGQMDQQAKDQINEEIVQSVTAWFGTIGNYFLPLLYGGLGTLCFVLRQFDGYIARRVLTNRTNHEIQNRLILGLITGSCIGIFINAMPGAAQATGVSAAAVTLTASAWAFIAGYNVEFLFKIIDALMHHVTASKHTLDDPAPAPRQ